MKKSLRLKRNLLHILYMILFWLFAFYIFSILRNYGIFAVDDSGAFVLVKRLEWRVQIIQATICSIILGISYGVLDIILNRELFRKGSFGFIILFKSIVYLLITIVLNALMMITYIILSGGVVYEELGEVKRFFLMARTPVMLLYVLICSFLINSFNQINQKFGPGVLFKLLTGRYHHPKEEEKIFMFIDMKSSTNYAERLGHIKFSQLIQDCFYDLADVVRQYKAHIEKYVGDEVLLTWDLRDGLENANCINTFFGFQEALGKKADYYLDKYNFVPEFKAGMNAGLVTVAEVGEIKKEIEHHGDVLNIASRIQNKCNEYNKKLLVSEFLERKLNTNKEIKSELLGSILLKGKEQTVNVYSIELKPISQS